MATNWEEEHEKYSLFQKEVGEENGNHDRHASDQYGTHEVYVLFRFSQKQKILYCRHHEYFWSQCSHVVFSFHMLSNINFLLGPGESYGPTTLHIRKIAASSLYSWTMYVIEIKCWHPYATRLYTSSLLVSAILWKSLIWPQLKSWKIFTDIFEIL